jgi:hypothetical protein
VGATEGEKVRYEIEAPSTGESMILDYSDWYHLLHLAARYGWRAQEDLRHYTTEDHTISAYEAEQITDALEKANHDLHKVSEGMEIAAQRLGVTAHFFPGLDKGPYERALEYFSGKKAGIVSRFIAMVRSVELVVRETGQF